MLTTLIPAAVLLAASLCTGFADSHKTAAPERASIYFVNISDGDTVASPVTVIFGLKGMGMAPAGAFDFENVGRHHLLVDRPPVGEGDTGAEERDFALPNDGNNRHVGGGGGGQTEATLDLAPDEHTLQIVLGDPGHVPFGPQLATYVITITVERRLGGGRRPHRARRFSLASPLPCDTVGQDHMRRNDMGQRLGGRTAIVTGGASGFGAGIVDAFLAEGAQVMIADINADAATAAAADRDGAVACTVDVARGASVEAMADAAHDTWGRVDIVVNNAGITHLPAALEEISEEDFDRVLAVNAKSVYLTARAFVPRMKAEGAGVFLNVASTAGLSPRPRLSWYNASKGWMITATKAMAVELAPAGIRVNAICPVAGETPLLASFMGEDTPEVRAKFLSTIPLGRFSQPQDMGAAAAFLCSEEASMITGVALEVDGGRCI